MLNESTLPFAARLRVLGLSLAVAAFCGAGLAPAGALAKDKPAPAKDKPVAAKENPKDKKDAKQGEAAQDEADKKAKKGGKSDKAEKSDKPDKTDKGDKAEKSGGGGKPEQLGSYGEWGAYLAQSGRDKTCYALSQPKERQPKAKLKDTAAYVFISSRPGDGVRNEVAINLGYATKDGSAATAEIDGDGWELITKGTNAWVKDQSKEREFVGALRGGAKLVVKASSAKGTATVDTYALKGLSDALARVVQECK